MQPIDLVVTAPDRRKRFPKVCLALAFQIGLGIIITYLRSACVDVCLVSKEKVRS